MKKEERVNRLLDFIIDTDYQNLEVSVLLQARKCFFDLASCICAGAKNHSAKMAADYVSANYPPMGG